MDEIAAEAGLSKPVLYKAFRDKSGLAAELLESATAELTHAVIGPLAGGGEPEQLVRAAIDAFVSFIERDPDVYRFIARGAGRSAQGAVGHRMVAGVGDQLALALVGALGRVGGSAGAASPLAYAVLGSVFLGAEWWLEQDDMTRDELVDLLTALVWGGLGGLGLDRLGGPIVDSNLAASLLEREP